MAKHLMIPSCITDGGSESPATIKLFGLEVVTDLFILDGLLDNVDIGLVGTVICKHFKLNHREL